MLSVFVQSCNLGRHVPVTFKDVCEQGIIPVTLQPDSPDSRLPPYAAGMQRSFIDVVGKLGPPASNSVHVKVYIDPVAMVMGI